MSAATTALRQIYRILGMGFMIGVIGGDFQPDRRRRRDQASAFQTLSYTRGFEADADATVSN